ncbi:MAG: DUF599 family protein [Hyphomicrobiaceae bacterium]|nr:DUF599 family protein [Hyphomicrobiaceae bacterium]
MIGFMTEPDFFALCYFIATVGLYRIILHRTAFGGRSLVGAVQAQRMLWMQNMARRENRMIDAVLLSSLSQGNAFFASTSAIAVGGLAASVGSGEKVQAMLERLPYVAPSSSLMWEVKLLLIMSVFIYAFFKFAWGFRLSHYTAIMIGATPLPGSPEAEVEAHARRTARLIGLAAEHTNSGLRSFYHAIAAIAWFFHPLAFIVATTWVMLILIRRDFFSRSRAVVLGDKP